MLLGNNRFISYYGLVMYYLLFFFVVVLTISLFMIFRYKNEMHTKIDIEKIAKEIINHHGFSSNTVRGFSCYIPDRSPFPSTEGLLLWSFSKTYRRIETQIQKYSSTARIYRMNEMLGLSNESYENEFIKLIQEYLFELKKSGNFHPIGNGIKLFGKVDLFNLAADLNIFLESPNKLRELELITINNSIVKFCENSNYFICYNKDVLITDEYLIKWFCLMSLIDKKLKGYKVLRK